MENTICYNSFSKISCRSVMPFAFFGEVFSFLCYGLVFFFQKLSHLVLSSTLHIHFSNECLFSYFGKMCIELGLLITKSFGKLWNIWWLRLIWWFCFVEWIQAHDDLHCDTTTNSNINTQTYKRWTSHSFLQQILPSEGNFGIDYITLLTLFWHARW